MTKSKKQKKIKRVLDSLNKAELSNDKGILINEKYKKSSTKVRRHCGRKRVCFNDEEFPIEFDYWDDWEDSRDGFRDGSDMKKIIKRKNGFWNFCWEEREVLNNKLKKINERRKVKKLLRKKGLNH